MFSFSYKKVTDVRNSEVDSMKKVSNMADFHFLQQGTVDVLLHRIKLDMSCSR